MGFEDDKQKRNKASLLLYPITEHMTQNNKNWNEKALLKWESMSKCSLFKAEIDTNFPPWTFPKDNVSNVVISNRPATTKNKRETPNLT